VLGHRPHQTLKERLKACRKRRNLSKAGSGLFTQADYSSIYVDGRGYLGWVVVEEQEPGARESQRV